MLFAQTQKINYAVLDRKVVSVKGENIDSLAKQLAALGSTDKEKVRVIFRWITENINYNVRIYNRNKIDPGNFYEEPEDTSAALPSLNDRVAAKVLKRKIAFCDGYSRLFSALCSRAGIPSEVIHGYARINQNSRERFGVNHSWNAVYLDSAWHLLDVTWASGFVSYDNEYIRQYNDFYYLTAPADFFRDHYPEEIQWALMEAPPLYREFNQQPFRHSGYNKYSIISYSPQKGIIEATVGDTIHIELKTKKEITSPFVSESYQPDPSVIMNSSPLTIASEKIILNHFVDNNAGDWIYVFCNEEVVLRYKLIIKRVVK